MICVIIDHFSFMVHLVPTVQMYCAWKLPMLSLKMFTSCMVCPAICQWPRLPIYRTILDHLHKLIKVDLQRSSAYHPHTDGLTEWTNCTISQMLRQSISPNQKDWAIKLPAIEFALNSAWTDSTGFSHSSSTLARYHTNDLGLKLKVPRSSDIHC